MSKDLKQLLKDMRVISGITGKRQTKEREMTDKQQFGWSMYYDLPDDLTVQISDFHHSEELAEKTEIRMEKFDKKLHDAMKEYYRNDKE